ncbi:hypothetical protein F2Q70_00012211 [Brassica cretica]|uniref:Uncharacterized protein n=1 Tax=Brassica cretica TaxID=69181 RepID=A0A8S9M3W9_BRACR|nr:hypothetical protein F2Q70_00012211 [Brassica cretica]
MIGGTGSMTPPSDHELPQSPAKSYSQAVAPGSRDLEERFSSVELLSDSKSLWSAYIVGHFMGDAPHIEEVRNSAPPVHDSVSNKVSEGLVIPENEEPWLTIPQSSPSDRQNFGKSARSMEVELPSTSSPSRFHLLSTDIEEVSEFRFPHFGASRRVGYRLLLLMATKRLIETMSGYTKDKIAVHNNAGKTTPAATAPMANAYANATVHEKKKSKT